MMFKVLNANLLVGALLLLSLTGCTLAEHTLATPSAEIRRVLLRADFQQQSVGLFPEAMLAREFQQDKIKNNGLRENRAAIVSENGNPFLRITYTAKEFGPNRGGVQFRGPFVRSFNTLYFAYRVRFDRQFDFGKGGKLPGLVGGTAPTGCVTDKAGFSARNMWRGGSEAVRYMYIPNKKSACGDDFAYLKNGPCKDSGA